MLQMLSAHIIAGLWAIFGFLSYTGRTVLSILKSFFAAVFGFLLRFFKKVFSVSFGWLKKEFKQPFYDIWCYILTPIAHAFGTLAHTHIQLKKTGQLGLKHAASTCAHALGRFFTAVFKILKISFNYVAPALCIAFLFALVNYAGTLQYSLTVEYNGNDLGVISSEGDYNQAQALVQDKITYTDGDNAVIQKPKFSVRMMQSSDTPVDTDNLSELMINSSDVGIVNAYGFYINDSLIAVYNEEEMERIRDALEDRLAAYYTQDTLSVSFADKVELTEGRYLEQNLESADSVISYINGLKKVEAFYVVKQGDTMSAIAKSLGITTEQLKEDNPLAVSGMRAGDILTYHFEEPNLSVVTTHYENYDQVIEKTIQYIYESKVEQYCEIMNQKGSPGLENVTVFVTETNGNETDRVVISRYVIEEMVPMIIRTGTKENTSLGGDTHVIEKLGTFIWPVGWDGGYSYVSSLYGYRKWDHSTHRAIDIAAKYGTDVYAASDGEVVFAGTYSAYGKMIIISHGYKYETVYGHLSAIDVEKGDKVEKGDVIGHVGMTGSASGNHLHFELRYDGDRMDPIYCLGGVGDHEVRNY